jgi:uncharacterized protein YggE
MKTFSTLFLLLLCTLSVNAQQSFENRIAVNSEASIDVPVDQVIFTIQLQSTDSTSIAKVYDKHKAAEKKIVKLLKDLKITDKNISYSLFSIGRQRDYEVKVWYYLGNQTVTFKLDSIALYADVQKRLIMEGFGEFGSSFAVKNLEPHETKALQKAIELAKKKANTLAQASDRKIKRIVTVTDAAAPTPLYNPSMRMMKAADEGGSLMEFSQTIPVTAQINVVFELE